MAEHPRCRQVLLQAQIFVFKAIYIASFDWQHQLEKLLQANGAFICNHIQCIELS